MLHVRISLEFGSSDRCWTTNHTRGVDALNTDTIGWATSVLFFFISSKITGMVSKLKSWFPQVFKPTVKTKTAITFMPSPAEAWRNERVHELNIKRLNILYSLIQTAIYWNFFFLNLEFYTHFICDKMIFCKNFLSLRMFVFLRRLNY